MPSSLSLDGLTFAMISSTASRVDPLGPTVFRYHQRGTLVWGDYTGDTVSEGRFVGSLVGDVLEISFGHAPASGGAVVRGDAHSRVEIGEDGRLRLIESFAVGDVMHESICLQR